MVIDIGTSLADDQHKVSDDLRKDASELGIEVIDHISTVAGDWQEVIAGGGCCVWQCCVVAVTFHICEKR